MAGRDRGRALGLTVLLAEADAVTREVLGRSLGERFGRVLAAATGAEALALAVRTRPDLALVGCRLPDMGAAALAVSLRQGSARLPLFVLGDVAELAEMLGNVSLPGLRVVVRPFDPARVVACLEEAGRELAARRSLGEAWGLVHHLLDVSPHPAAVLAHGTVVSVNRALLRFLGLATVHEFMARGADLGPYLADAPAGGVAALIRDLADDRLDREHRLRLVRPDRPDQPPRVFQASLARLPGRERWLLSLSDITELELERRELLDLANLDPLTRVCNRRKLQEILDDETARANRYHLGLAAMVLDIDHFKTINDTHGHDAGDAVLVELAGRLGRAVRQVDRLARLGGEEFVVVAPGISLDAALEVAERLRAVVAEADFAAAGRVTVSIGVAAHRPGEAAGALLKRADAALYRAKAGGRNKVEPEASPQPPR